MSRRLPSAFCIARHIGISAGTLHQITTVGMYGGASLAVALSEAGTKPAAQIAADVIASIAGGIKTGQHNEPPVA